MKQEFSNNVPIYIQIMDEIKMSIFSGQRQAGDKMPSVRELAQEFGVNPNTMQRALSELEREQLVYTERTSGRYITTDGGLIMSLKNNLAMEELKKFLLYMENIGFTKDEIISKIKQYPEEGKKNG